MSKFEILRNFFRRNALQGGLLVLGVAVCAALCGAARDKGWLGTPKADGLPPVASQLLPQGQPKSEAEASPQTMTLQLGNMERVVTAGGTVQSTVRQDVNTSLTKPVVSVRVQVGSQVSAGDVLCQLDTTALDKDIEAAQASIARAEANDAAKLSQAERKLAQLQEKKASDEGQQAQAVQEALDALEAAKVKAATEAANSNDAVKRFAEEVERQRLDLEAKQTQLEALLQNPDADPKDVEALQEACNLALTTLGNLTEQYTATWQNAYDEAYSSCRPADETEAYERAATRWDDILRKDQQDIADAQSAVESCRMADSAATHRDTLAKKQAERAQYTITAPVGGTVTAVGARVGSTPGNRSGDALFTIQNTGSLVVEAKISESDAVGLSVNMPVTVTAGALEGRRWEGTVSAISPVADEDACFTVTVRLPSGADQLTVGMTADIRAVTGVARDIFAVPHSAVVQTADGSAVYAAQEPDGLFKAVPVQTGMENSRRVEIEGDGLCEGLSILTHPPQEGTSEVAP